MPSVSRKDPLVAGILKDWRRLTGGTPVRDPQRCTLLAVSGGADSSALVAAFAKHARHTVVAHVVHDMRPNENALADRDAVSALARRFGMAFCEETVTVRAHRGNAEAIARRLRYAALERLASLHACPFVATAHHADDLAETVLMRLVRGAGPRGASGIAPARALSPQITLIRPMLGLTHEECLEICRRNGIIWQEDATNTDTSRLRAAIRADILPRLRSLSPGFEKRMARAAPLHRDAAGLIAAHAQTFLETCESPVIRVSRAQLRSQPRAVIGEVLRLMLLRNRTNRADRLSFRVLGAIIDAVQSRSSQPRKFRVSGMLVKVTARAIECSEAVTAAASAASLRRPSSSAAPEGA